MKCRSVMNDWIVIISVSETKVIPGVFTASVCSFLLVLRYRTYLFIFQKLKMKTYFNWFRTVQLYVYRTV